MRDELCSLGLLMEMLADDVAGGVRWDAHGVLAGRGVGGSVGGLAVRAGLRFSALLLCIGLLARDDIDGFDA